jgi:drug/metabolite transporter (DMT)-like permease
MIRPASPESWRRSLVETDGSRPRTLSPAVAALVGTAFIGSIMGMFARELATELNVAEQVFLRSLCGSLVLFVVCRRRIDLSKYRSAPPSDLALGAFRAISIYVIAISLGTLAFVNGKYGPVAIVMALPMTAILSSLVFRERISPREAMLVALAFAGAAITIYGGRGGGFELEWPLICALFASVFISFGMLAQKKQSSHLGNFEITFFMLCVATVVMAAASGIYIVRAGEFPTVSPYVLAVGVVSGVANIGFLLTSNYGMPRVRGVVANNILAMQPVFATVVGVLVYGEILDAAEVLGGIMILAAVALIARERAGSRSRARAG